MTICCVSDVHIKQDNDEASRLFRRFLELNRSTQAIVLLGDIFDLMVGGQVQWLERFPQTFQKLVETSQYTKIYYLEGNHDFHVKNIFASESMKNIQHTDGDLVLNDQGKKIRFSHGDDVEIENDNYRLYKKIIKHRFVEMLANEFVPVKAIAKIGDWASKESAKHSKRYVMDQAYSKKIKEKFRRSADDYYEKLGPFDMLVCGHSHVKDQWHSPKGYTYINNGYFLAEKTYAEIANGAVSFVSI